MSAHTPGPWRLKPSHQQGRSAAAFYIIGGVRSRSPGVAHIKNSPTQPVEANARRIVACVNACEGVTTERLEDLGKPLMQHLFGADERAARQVKERDELLAVLEEARMGLLWYQNEFPQEVRQCDYESMERIDAAIAKATGAQP